MCEKTLPDPGNITVNKTKFMLSWNYILLVGNRPLTQRIRIPVEVDPTRKNRASYQQKACLESTPPLSVESKA